jgi:hypothetical protein
MAQPAHEISTPFPSVGSAEAIPGNFDIAARQAELNAYGVGMVEAISRGVPEMLRGGVIAEVTTELDRAAGQVRYGTTPRDTSDYPGGWREITLDNKTKLVRVELLQPDGSNGRVDGHAEVTIADIKMVGQTKLTSNLEALRVAIDANGVPHVSGKDKGFKFNVDHPSPRSMHADLGIADAAFRRRADALTAIAQQTQIQLALPELPSVH